MLQFLPPKKQSDDRIFNQQGFTRREVRSRWVPGANGEKLRDRSTSKFFHKMINFQFIPRAGMSF